LKDFGDLRFVIAESHFL
jgi:hypothetical protein